MSYGDNPGGEQGHGYGPAFGPPSYPAPPGYHYPPGSVPSAYRAWGIIAIICGVLFNTILGFPTAIVGFRYGGSVSQLWESGDVEGARRASRRARAWLIASSLLDVLGIILLVVVIIGQVASSNDFNNPSVVAASIKSQVQQKLSDKSGPAYDPGVTVTSVVCTKSTATTDHCVIKFSDGSSLTQTATISGDGTAYTAK